MFSPVSPYYDPMLSKLVYCAPDRNAAIQGLSKALDDYVIGGVQHNARLVQSVLREPAFIKGETPTSFLPTHYPDGFTGVNLTDEEEEEYAVAAAAIDALRRDWLERPPLAGSADEEVVMVRMGGMFGKATYRVEFDFEDGTVDVALVNGDGVGQGRSITLDPVLDFQPSNYLAKVVLDGNSRSVQVVSEASTGEYKLQMYGADRTVLIQSVREYELSAHMKEPAKLDTSNLVLSPMPGSLISYAVKDGDVVQAGQELCIVEAMKMQVGPACVLSVSFVLARIRI